MKINAKLDQSVAIVRDHDSNENFENYREVIGKIMGSLYLDVEEKLWHKYPELRPKQMGGPYEVNESIIEPRFYNYKNEQQHITSAVEPDRIPRRFICG